MSNHTDATSDVSVRQPRAWKSRAITIVAILIGGGVVLAVVTFVWPWSTSFARHNGDQWIEIAVARGGLTLLIVDNEGSPFFGTFVESFLHGRRLMLEQKGFVVPADALSKHMPPGVTVGGFQIPLVLPWSVIALLGLFAYLVFMKCARALRRRKGLCAWCSYDLRGSESGVCPECGMAQTR